MDRIRERLDALEAPIACVVVGIGSIGKGLAHQIEITPGFQLLALADIKIDKAINVAKWLGRSYRVVETKADLEATVRAGDLAIAEDGAMVAGCDQADVLLECSSGVMGPPKHALAAFAAGSHVVTMNFESELIYGPYLLKCARDAGLVYSTADGDQPTVIKKLVDDMIFWGLEPVMLGNMKGFHDQYTNPTKIAPEADKRDLDHKMCSSYTDGSKLCVEMATVANAFDGRVLQPGMMGPRIPSVYDIFDHFDFASFWKPGDAPIVDYVLGAKPTGGVFAIGHTDNAYHQFSFSWYPSYHGPGPFYLFYRHFHLPHFEALRAVAEAVIDGTTRLASWAGMKTNVITYAKKDLAAGEILDGLGGYASYGFIENLDEADSLGGVGLPQLISEGVRLKRAIAKDQRIRLEDCEIPQNDERFELYQKAIDAGAQPYS